MTNLPKISVNIAVYNDAENLRRCLTSVYSQEYPNLEVLVVDGGSTDATIDVARQTPATILFNERRDGASGRTLGLLKATGDFHIYLDADMELGCEHWFHRMVHPMLVEKQIAGSFTRFISRRTDTPLNRFLSYNEFQLDPMLRFLSTRLDRTFARTNADYSVCRFLPNSVPVVGVIMFRMPIIKKFFSQFTSKSDWIWSDVDFAVQCANEGKELAYVPKAGIYHTGWDRLSTYFRKKRRDVTKTYIPTSGHRLATYANLGEPGGFFKVVGWVVFANLVIPGVVIGIVDSLNKRDTACMYYPVLTTLGTDYILGLFLTRKDGREVLLESARKMVSRLFPTGRKP
jgi:glycosyltransferase involved in cell wall biosynthesis